MELEFHVDDVFAPPPRQSHFTLADVPLLQSALTKKGLLTFEEHRAIQRAMMDHEEFCRQVATDFVVNNLEEAP